MKEDILKLREEGKSYREISRLLGCSKGSVSYYCGKGQKEKARLRVKNYRSGYEIKPKTIKKERCCKNCNSKLPINNNVFCNKDCYLDFYKKVNLEKFENGEIVGNITIRKVLIEKYGDKCFLCKQNSIWNDLPLVLQVDHIDGNSDDNTPNNLRLLCPNCHSQTETSKDKKTKKETKRNSYLRKYKGYK